MTSLNAEAQALRIQVRDGEVVMTGPRVAIALTPAAAVETARRLAEAAVAVDAAQASQTGSDEA